MSGEATKRCLRYLIKGGLKMLLGAYNDFPS